MIRRILRRFRRRPLTFDEHLAEQGRRFQEQLRRARQEPLP